MEELKNLMYSINLRKEFRFIVNYSEDITHDFNDNFEEIVCNLFKIDKNRLATKSRELYVVWSRYFIFDYLRTNTTSSLNKIGKKYNRDHSTVAHAIKKHKQLLNDKVYHSHYNEFLKQVNK